MATSPDLRSRLRLVAIININTWSGAIDPIDAAIRGGITMLQVRDKTSGARRLFEAALELKPICRDAGIPLIINDRPDVALAADADGVHVGPDDLPPALARIVLGDRLLGSSARDAERIALAEGADVDYLGVGALRATGTKPDADPIGLDGITILAATTDIPVVAIGGVAPEDAPRLRRAGASGLAVASGIFDTPDPRIAAQAYRAAWGGS